jgi:hypothetical protein
MLAQQRLRVSNGRVFLAFVWIAVAAGAALLVGVGSPPVSAATPLWTINFTGHGTSQSDATETLNGGCPTTDHTTVKSAYHWSVSWSHVALSTPPVTGKIIGSMLGTAYETETKKVSGGGCTGDVNCDKTVDFSANEGLDGSNPAALLFHKSSANASNGVLILDLLTWADQTAQCESLDPNDTGFLLASPLSFNPSATDALAASATIPLSELRHSGKIVLVVHKTAFNYPTPGDSDCSNTGLGLNCSQSQNWDGTITIIRSG